MATVILAVFFLLYSIIDVNARSVRRAGHLVKTSPQHLETHCGQEWHHRYATLHQAILHGQQAPGFAVALSADTGLADRLAGIFSVFYYALISGRAFQISNLPGVVGLEEALEPASINWIQSKPDRNATQTMWLSDVTMQDGLTVKSPPTPSFDTSRYWPIFEINRVDFSGPKTEQLLAGDVRSNPPGHANARTVVVASNRGRVWGLFDNPHHKQTLLQYGLRPETAIACAFTYLFRPRQEVKDMFRTTWAALKDPHVLKIGIQVRFGDTSFTGGPNASDLAWKRAAAHFACAAEIEKTRASPGQRVIYFLMSDSVALRQVAKARLGDKVLTDTETPSLHVGCIDGGSCQVERQVKALRLAVGDMLSFSMADYHVYTHNSGFGRLGAWRSFNWHHQYAVKDGQLRSCGVSDYDDLKHDARAWSGVR